MLSKALHTNMFATPLYEALSPRSSNMWTKQLSLLMSSCIMKDIKKVKTLIKNALLLQRPHWQIATSFVGIISEPVFLLPLSKPSCY